MLGPLARRRREVILVAATLPWIACGGSNNAATTPPTTPPVSASAYALDSAGTGLVVLGIDASSGTPSVIQREAVAAGRELALQPGGGTLYLAGGDRAGTVRSYVRSYGIDGATGRIQPSPSQTWEPAFLRPPLAVAANQRRVYAVGGAPFTGTHGGWVGFDTQSGVLGPAYALPYLYEPRFVFTAEDGQRAFATAQDADEDYADSLFTFAVDENGDHRLLAHPPIAGERALAAALAGGHLFVVGSDADAKHLAVFAVDTFSGRVERKASYDFTGGAASLATGPNGDRLVLTTSDELHLFGVDTGSGALARLDVVGLPSTEGGVPYRAALPAGRLLYVSGTGRGIRIYRISSADRLELASETVEGGGPIVVRGLPLP